MAPALLSHTLSLTSEGMARVSERALRLQDALAPVAAAAPPGARSALQELDQLQQEAQALASFVAAVAAACPAHWRLDISPLVADVPLGELVQRLTGRAEPMDESHPGAVELF